jgi:hypothetical protein
MVRLALAALAVGPAALGVAITGSQAMAQSVGVAVCDNVLEKMDVCIEKIPEFMQDDFRALNDNMRKLLLDTLKQPKGKAVAETLCKTNSDGYRKQKLFQEYGCRF